MKLANPFPPSVREMYRYETECHLCGRSDAGLELHHITGRGSSSIFNACLLCTKCHQGMKHNESEEQFLLGIAWAFALGMRWTLTEDDREFIRSMWEKRRIDVIDRTGVIE
jgi:hypothetical protein